MLLVRPHEHLGLLGMAEAIEVIESAFRAWANDATINAPRQIVCEDTIRLAAHQAAVPGLRAAGIMAHTGARSDPDGHRNFHAASLVFDLVTGALDAIVFGQVLCGPPITGVADLRTATTSAVGAKYLARAEAASIGVLGSGRQACSHLAAIAAVRRLRWARVYSRSPGNRDSFAQEMAAALGMEVTAVGEAEAAVAGVDIVLVATNTDEPVLHGDWLSPGQHVTSVLGGNTRLDAAGRPVSPPRRDLDDAAIRRSDVVVINSRAQAAQDFHGDIVLPIEAGLLGWDRVHELGELIVGRAPGRSSDSQITLYKNNGGQGVADVAIAALVAQRARALRLGTEI